MSVNLKMNSGRKPIGAPLCNINLRNNIENRPWAYTNFSLIALITASDFEFTSSFL